MPNVGCFKCQKCFMKLSKSWMPFLTFKRHILAFKMPAFSVLEIDLFSKLITFYSNLQAPVEGGEEGRRSSHCSGLFHWKDPSCTQASFASGNDDCLSQLPHYKFG